MKITKDTDKIQWAYDRIAEIDTLRAENEELKHELRGKDGIIIIANKNTKRRGEMIKKLESENERLRENINAAYICMKLSDLEKACGFIEKALQERNDE